MKLPRLLLAVCALALVSSACVSFRDSIEDRLPATTVRVLRFPDSLELVLLDPRSLELRPIAERDIAPERRFHGYEVTAHAALDDARLRQKLMELVFEAVLRAREDPSEVLAPRWGVRAVKEGKVVDMLCTHPGGRIEVYSIDRKVIEELIAPDYASEVEKIVATTGLTLAAK